MPLFNDTFLSKKIRQPICLLRKIKSPTPPYDIIKPSKVIISINSIYRLCQPFPILLFFRHHVIVIIC